jgi:hypothetical protein
MLTGHSLVRVSASVEQQSSAVSEVIAKLHDLQKRRMRHRDKRGHCMRTITAGAAKRGADAIHGLRVGRDSALNGTLIARGAGEQQITFSEIRVLLKQTGGEDRLRAVSIMAVHEVKPDRNARRARIENTVVAEFNVIPESVPGWEPVLACEARLRVVEAQIHCCDLSVAFVRGGRQRRTQAAKRLRVRCPYQAQQILCLFS